MFRFKKIWITIGIIIIFLLLFNLSLKVFWDEKPILKNDPKLLISDNKCLIYEIESNQKIIFDEENIFFTNDMGLRDKNYYKKKPGEFRIITLGDSITYGISVYSNQNLFSEVLEDMLNDNESKMEYSVINAGTPAYNLNQELCLLRDKLMVLEPDLIIWNLYQNDLGIPQLNGVDHYSMREKFPIMNFFDVKIIKDIKLFKVLKNTIVRSYGNSINKKYIFGVEYIEKNKYAFDKAMKFFKDNNLDFVIVEFPYTLGNNPYDEPYSIEPIHFFLTKKAEEYNLSVIELIYPLSNYTGGHLEKISGDKFGHLKKEGHLVVGKIMYNELIKRELIPDYKIRTLKEIQNEKKIN